MKQQIIGRLVNGYYETEVVAEAFCAEGLRDLWDIPKGAKEIVFVLSDKEPRHDHWFRVSQGDYPGRSDWWTVDEDPNQNLFDCGTDDWLTDNFGNEAFVWIEY